MHQRRGTRFCDERVNFWWALQAQTDPKSDAGKIIMGFVGEDRLKTWQTCASGHQRFSQAIVAKQGMVLAEFSSLINKPAETPAESISSDRARTRVVNDVCGKAVERDHHKSVLVGLLDPITRPHTVEYHAADRSS